jgi:uncharacterized protein
MVTQDYTGIVYPSTPFSLGDSLILLGRRGSEAHGLYIPGGHGGVDDRDLMGIVIPPKNYYLGMHRWEVAEAINGPWDVVLYELRKFVHLLCKQNPNVLQLLWLEDEDYLSIPKRNRFFGANLVRARLLFRHATYARSSFVGYAHGQLKRMTAFDATSMQRIVDLEAMLTDHGINLGHAAEGKLRNERPDVQVLVDQYVGMRRTYHKAYMGAKRWAMVQKIGYDPKNAAHLIRLLHLGYEYLTTGHMQVRRTWDREMLIEMKQGLWPLDAIQAHADEWFKKVRETDTVLPESIDDDRVDELVTSMVGDFHGFV